MAIEEEDVEYESDPEEAQLSLAARRREVSDDEDGEEEEIERRELPPRRIDSRFSDCESDGEGAAAEYDDEEESEIEEEELEEDEDLAEEQQYEERESGSHVKATSVELNGHTGRSVGEFSGTNQVEEEKKENDGLNDSGVYLQDDQFEDNAAADGTGEEKKDNEPFAVPTAGAFYMHDDRFRDSAGGRHRRTPGGRKLWESKDNRKWGHDKFEEMANQERHYEEGRRSSRGRNRGRGKNQGEERGYPRGNKSKTFNNNNQNNAPNNQNNALNNQINAPEGVRGRGPRRYQSSWKSNSEAPTQNKKFGKSAEKSSYASSPRVSESTLNVESDSVPARKHVFSSLNSASPPFYPSASSSKEISLTQKKDGQAAPLQRNMQSSVTDESFSMSQSSTMQGKNVADFMGMNKLYIDDSVSPPIGKPLTNLQLQASGSSLINPSQSPQSRVQGRVQTPMGQMPYQSNDPHNQSNAPHNQVNNRVGTPSQLHHVQRAPVQAQSQASVQASVQQLGYRTGNGTQSSSPAKSAFTSNSFESREIESPPESSKSKTALVGKGKGSVQGSGRGSFPYGGAQIIGAPGNLSNVHGDQNFPTTPAFLPVMQFGGQHPGGMGVPAVGMAFPGYVGNPGLGNSEMTWLPVLAGAAGALGATYCSPYLSVDSAYHARPSGQISSLPGASSKENNANKPGNELKPSQRPELANDEYGQRQNKARRYTEMKFDQ